MRLIKNIYTIIEVAAMLLAVNLIYSCEENDPKGFNGEDAVYFQTDANNWAITNDSINYSFAGKNVDTAVVNLLVDLMGNPSDHDRMVKIHINESLSTAQAGVHYEPLKTEYILNAGEMQTVIPIVVYNKDPQLEQKAVVLSIALDETNELKLGITNRTQVFLLISNILMQPTYWKDSRMDNQFGPYTRGKHELIIKLLGRDFPATAAEYKAESTYWKNARSYINNYLKDNYPVTDREGNVIEPWQ